MGWTFQQGKGTREEVAQEIGIGRTWGGDMSATDLHMTLRNAYFIYRKNGQPVEIGVYMIDRRPRDARWGGPAWGYKPLTETSGPIVVDCPLVLLDMVPAPTVANGQTYESGETWAREWRERVCEYHARKAEKRAQRVPVAEISEGGWIKLAEGLKITGWLQVRRFVTARGRKTGVIAGSYRVKLSQIVGFSLDKPN